MRDDRWKQAFFDYSTSSFAEILQRTAPHLLPGRSEPSPEEGALASEESRTDSVLDPKEAEVVRRIWLRMRLFRPHLYKVFKPWIDHLQLRDERSGYSHGVYRGWYAEQARRLERGQGEIEDGAALSSVAISTVMHSSR